MQGGSPSFLRTKDAAELCGLSESTLAKLRLTGNGPAYYKVGRSVLYGVNELQDWLDTKKRHSTSEQDVS